MIQKRFYIIFIGESIKIWLRIQHKYSITYTYKSHVLRGKDVISGGIINLFLVTITR